MIASVLRALLLAAACGAVATPPCDRSRRVLRAVNGTITDGPSGSNYTQDSHCEWLIVAPRDRPFITLRFTSMGTECSYDYVFVHDGDSYESPLLASFSGRTEPQSVRATNGRMLVLLYSDTNYVLDGFRADFSAHECPDACSARGDCVDGECRCEEGRGGPDCATELCPRGCSRRGACSDGRCECRSGFAGASCSLGESDERWHGVSRAPVARAAHVAVYVSADDSLYAFGGYDLNGPLDSLHAFRFSSGRWEDADGTPLAFELERPTTSRRASAFDPEIEEFESSFSDETYYFSPDARYGHAACPTRFGFAVYGGKLQTGKLSSELWTYDVRSRKWNLVAVRSDVAPPPLTRHSLTAVGDEIYLFGGSTEDGEFSSRMFKISLKLGNVSGNWEEVHPRGGKELDVRVVAHSTVYHSHSHSLIVYGGVVAGVARFSKLSDRMFSFDLTHKYWAELHYPRTHLRDTYIPRERAFHTANVLGNYLVVFGGYTHLHNKEEICYDNQMYLYHLGCHNWISGDVLGGNRVTDGYPKAQGVFAHASAIRPPSTLLLFGGYHGNVNGDLLAYVFPTWFDGMHNQDSESSCVRHKSYAECLANPECGWCSADETCYGRTVGSNCTTNLQSVRCGGICPALGDCHACLTHGAPLGLLEDDIRHPLPSVSTKLGLHHCSWCVQNARCHHKNDNYGVCGEDTPSQSPGWWGPVGTEITQPDQCRFHDKRPGLTFIKYQHPVNFSYPDSVTIINATTVDFNAVGNSGRNDHTDGEMIAQLRGFLHIPKAWSGTGETLRLCAGHAKAELYLDQRQLVANISAYESSMCSNTEWPALTPGRLAVHFQARKSIQSNPFTLHQQSKMELQHNKSHENAKVFTFEYLEPFSNGTCSQYDNCLHCLTDSACGWCELSEKCISRSLSETKHCKRGDNWRYLTLQPSSCPNCSNYISCSRCVANNACEWWAEDARCGRKGRIVNAVQKLEHCPQPCHSRNNCSTCLDERGRCVWCEATHQCFSFSVYTSEYQFGLCREWLDRAVNNPGANGENARRTDQCKSCTSHYNCTSCLRSLSCGWCYSQENPINGLCIQGDFGKPQIQCDVLLNISSFDAMWAYAQCPDVDECSLNLHDCHKEAICTNTHGSYSCNCQRGYIGDGKLTCTKTCYNNCIHGYCVGAPDYVCQCDLGWTGPDCADNCGCNNHSTCHNGIGLCDECQDWTEGQYCDKCKKGSFGNATASRGCRKCDCNEHGDEKLGICDSQSGICYCKDNTVGSNCENCRMNYYGDARIGGTCFYQCESRGMLSNHSQQGLGSYVSRPLPWEGPTVNECLWIISPGNISSNGLIQLTIESNRLNVPCSENAIYVYDGLPGTKQSQLIGVFCSDAFPKVIESKSGNLTIYYKQGRVEQGFEATYKILGCENDCLMSHICQNDRCVCPEGYSGFNCDKQLCPNDCNSDTMQGVCDKDYGRCLCQSSWGGTDCSKNINANQIIFTELFNSHYLADSMEHLQNTLPRFGHSVNADKRGSLWMFGGYSLSHGPLNDIRLFDTKNNTWMQVTVEAYPEAKMPERRYFHAAEMIHHRQMIYVYGGLGVQHHEIKNKTLGDFWQFNLKDRRWSNISRNTQPPPLAGHTITLQKHQDVESLVLIGGFSFEDGYLNDVWEYDLSTAQWNILETSGTMPFGIFGHSTVYHPTTQSFYVYGGYLHTSNGTSMSNKLYCLNYPTLLWNELPVVHDADGFHYLPKARFLHSAVSTEDYMVIVGGHTDFKNLSDVFTAYVYSCNQWIRLDKGVDIVGELPIYSYAQAMTLDPESGTLYIVGGWDGVAHSQVIKILLPSDLCELWSAEKDMCLKHKGCSFCSVGSRNASNASHCYSYGKLNQCKAYNGAIYSTSGIQCNLTQSVPKLCTNLTNCDSCLASWPLSSITPICRWCSTCGSGKCIKYGQNCPNSSGNCDHSTVNISDVKSCPRECIATDCKHCNNNEKCMWTRHIPNSKDVASKTNDDFTFEWYCSLRNSLLKANGQAKQLEHCPVDCHLYQNCHSCLESVNTKFHGCQWATRLNQCLPVSFQPLYCAGGVCGLVIEPDKIDQCPSPCSNFTQCDKCLNRAHCGWCSLDGANGAGVCTEGSLEGPGVACEAIYREQINIGNDTSLSWNFVHCPPENECENNHHRCDLVSEHCEDLPTGYRCICGKGHRDSGGTCVPFCRQGCVRGSCVKPDVCQCDFGYVGANCSIQCQCNGHSDCEGPDRLNKCLECQNNTMGSQCDKCKPLFVGNPVNNGLCIPCIVYCNGHSNICLSDSANIAHMTASQIEEYLKEGPIAGAKCLHCSNNTNGLRCDKCIDGYFRGSEDFRTSCRPCECHGHGDICDPVTGEKCNCANNTESDATCQTSSLSKNSAQECWRYQCIKCKDSFMGDPKNGHQCYKMMTADNKMCFDGKLIDECKGKTRLLQPGQTVYFVVIPRFMNVDIRVIIDVTQGVLDFFMSPNDSSFVVAVNGTTGAHRIDLDPSFLKNDALFNIHSVFGDNSSDRIFKSKSLDGNMEYNLIKHYAENLNTYVTVDKKNTLLWVQGLKNRLILTLPQMIHDLGYTKFYLILRGMHGNEASSAASRGMIFFRQDQLHIDLFVFFSVFFSCFFLFLAVCVVVWKAKQASDVRRARRRHVVEMLTMAKRPFATVTLMLGPQSPPVQRKRSRTKHPVTSTEVCPVAVEPTGDGLAAVTTIFVKLPGGRSAPVRLALASSLVLLARQLPISNKTFLRRRSVHNQPAPPM